MGVLGAVSVLAVLAVIAVGVDAPAPPGGVVVDHGEVLARARVDAVERQDPIRITIRRRALTRQLTNRTQHHINRGRHAIRIPTHTRPRILHIHKRPRRRNNRNRPITPMIKRHIPKNIKHRRIRPRRRRPKRLIRRPLRLHRRPRKINNQLITTNHHRRPNPPPLIRQHPIILNKPLKHPLTIRQPLNHPPRHPLRHQLHIPTKPIKRIRPIPLNQLQHPPLPQIQRPNHRLQIPIPRPRDPEY